MGKPNAWRRLGANRKRHIRAEALRVARGECFWCAAELTLDTMTIDHLIPFAQIGRQARNPFNEVACCLKCNGRKEAKLAPLGSVEPFAKMLRWACRHHPVASVDELQAIMRSRGVNVGIGGIAWFLSLPESKSERDDREHFTTHPPRLPREFLTTVSEWQRTREFQPLLPGQPAAPEFRQPSRPQTAAE